MNKQVDNWVNRTEGMVCQTCARYVEKVKGFGRCRRRAPTMDGWPPVFHDDYCWEHKLDEAEAQKRVFST